MERNHINKKALTIHSDCRTRRKERKKSISHSDIHMFSSDVDIYNMESVLILMTDAATDQFRLVVVFPIFSPYVMHMDMCV